MASAEGRLVEAGAQLTRALETFRGIGARLDAAIVMTDLAVLRHVVGDVEAAGDHAQAARNEFDALGAPRWIERLDDLLRAGGRALPQAPL